jgi:multidrug efflux pump subunit AcrA (membrane-fusion protein)
MKNIQKFIQAGFVILIFSAIGFRLVEVKKERTETLNSLKESDLVVPVQTVTANKTPMNQTIIATGTFKPMKMITLKAEIQGRVEALPIEEGSCLDTSSIVCHIENQGIRDRLKSAHLELRKARKDLERYEKMAQKKAVSANQLENF